MDNSKLEFFWDELPTKKEEALTYADLYAGYGLRERQVRLLMHELSRYDNGDDFVLIRSSGGKGFYKTDDKAAIEAYRRECLNKGRSVFAPVKKINRILNANSEQFEIENNLRVYREEKGITQNEACLYIRQFDKAIDKAMLSKFENSVCLPTPYQLTLLARLYGCRPSDLVHIPTVFDI